MRNKTASVAIWFLALLGLMAACSNGGEDDACKANLLSGDLVITEIMANPEGTDEGREWFEIYNATTAPIDLEGVKLIASRADGTSDLLHVMRAISIEPGQYLVCGGVIDDVKPAYVDYAYGADLGSLRNTGGRLSLECGENVVDRIVYSEVDEGYSWGFDGSQVPDAAANDDLGAWCNAEVEYISEAYGTPGSSNDVCEGTLPPTRCMEGEVERDVVGPSPGDVVITEFMPNPQAVGDTEGEWFEVFFANNVDLNGLQMGKVAGTVDNMVASRDCIPVSAGSFLVFAKSDDPLVNGGLPEVAWTVGFALSNTADSLFVGYGGQVLDALSYSGSGTGASTSLDPGMMNVTDNDNPDFWCEADIPYGSGDMGTPGEANYSCGIVPPGQCYGADGELRTKVPPVAGELLITELMANPDGTDTGQEWFEILVLADHPVDLGGLQVGRVVPTVETQLSIADCLQVAAGDHVLLAQDGDNLVNGGLPEVDIVYSDLTLYNSGASMALFIGLDDVVFDAVTYATPGGASWALDPAHNDIIENDDLGLWCESEVAYGSGGAGSPGEANPSCGIVPEGQCLVAGVPRDKVEPVAGDLVITEFMANPNAASDTTAEWFEVYVGRDVDLNGLQIGRTGVDQTLPEGECLRMTAGSYAVFAVSDVSAENGNLPRVDAVMDFSLSNSGGGLYVGYGDVELDSLTYAAAWVGDGVSIALDPDFMSPAGNDLLENWCDGSTAYGAGDLGSPGAANAQCL